MSKLLSFLKRPYIIAPLTILFFVLLWVQIIAPKKTVAYDVVEESQNLLQNGSFDAWTGGNPNSWNVTGHARIVKSVSQVNGFIGGSGLRVDIAASEQGNATITSGPVDAKSGTRYLFKTFYETNTELDLLVERTSKDGSVTTDHIKHYPDYDYPWSTLSGNFTAAPDDKSFRVMVAVTGKGYVELDSSYLVHTAPSLSDQKMGDNLLANPLWQTVETGKQEAVFESQNGYQTARIKSYTDGQIAWKPQATTVQPSELLTFSAVYSSAQKSELGVDYVLNDGSRIYRVIRELNPVSQPVKLTIDIEVPQNVVSAQPSIQLARVGQLDVKDFWLSRTKSPASFSKPRVSITFDDGWLSSYVNGASLLDSYGYQGTFYVNPGLFGSREYMQPKDISELLGRGHQIGSHTDTHIDLTAYSQETVVDELDRSNAALKEYGVTDIDFASPFGKHDQSVLPLITERHLTHRGTDTGINTKQNYDTSNLKGLFMRKEVSDKELADFLAQTKTSNGWLILIYHQIEASENPFALDRETFLRHLNLIKISGIEVQTVRSAASELSRS